MNMTSPRLLMLSTIVEMEKIGGPCSLFQLNAEAGLSYSSGWNFLNDLELTGLVIVERNRSGVPLKIHSTEEGRDAIDNLTNHPDQPYLLDVEELRLR